jgi:glutamine synthetase
MTPSEVLKIAKEKNVQSVDLKFVDLHGTWQHFTIPLNELDEKVFVEGLGFDGSSIRGWKGIECSDMLCMPDPNVAFFDPFTAVPTLSIVCDIEDPMTREPYDRSPRGIARKAEEYLKSTGLADTCYMGPEAEFFVFDDVRYKATANECFYAIDSDEGIWNTDRDEGPNQGYKIRHKEGYFPVQPTDQQHDLRDEMMHVMNELGNEFGIDMHVERQHHEVATAGQAEIDLRFSPLLEMADKMCMYKYVVKNVAHRNGKTATFMPKPLFGDNGSGMHVHSSLWKDKKPLFAGDGYAGLSQMALYYIGGILKHAPALCAITNPTNNSYKRLVPGYEAPVILAMSARNRSAICRIPTYSPSPKAKRVEFRCPDPASNPYLCLSAIMMAGLDGIQNKIDPGEGMDKNLYDLPPEEAKMLKTVPESLKGAIEALKADHEFLLKGGVFSEDFLDNFCKLKMAEYDQVRLRVHPIEYFMYYDC